MFSTNFRLINTDPYVSRDNLIVKIRDTINKRYIRRNVSAERELRPIELYSVIRRVPKRMSGFRKIASPRFVVLAQSISRQYNQVSL